MRLLFLPRETFPTTRVDVEVLFGRELCARAGHTVDFVMQAANGEVSPGEHSWHGQRVWVGATDMRGGFLHRLHRHWLSFSHDLRMLRRLRRGGYDAVQVRDKFLVGLIALACARLWGVRSFFWLSFPVPEAQLLRARSGTARHPWLGRLRGWSTGFLLYRVLLPRSDHVFVQSEQMRTNFCARGLDRSRMTPVPMGVSLANLVAVRDARGEREPGPITLCYLGVISPERKLDMLVEALAHLRGGGMGARLLIIGDGQSPQERASLEHCAEELGVRNHLEITGFLPWAQAMALASAADICLSPIYPTPVFLVATPTKLVEYLALGVPVVANDHPDQRQVLRESRAGVCAPWGARHFARAIRWLMNRSAAERADMGRRGQEWVQTHRDYGRIARDVERVYRDVIGAIPAGGAHRSEVHPCRRP